MAAVKISDLRQPEWGRTHDWDIQFPTYPVPGFQGWVPAISVQKNIYIAKNLKREVATTVVDFNWKSDSLLYTITFADDIANNMQQWMDDWFNSLIMTKLGGLNYIMKTARLIQIQKLDPMKNVIKTWEDWVIPDVSMDWKGTELAQPVVSEFSLVIVGSNEG